MPPNPSDNHPQRPLDPSQFRPTRRVFDIAPPGRTPASATSRPLLAGQKPAVQDMSMRPNGHMPGIGGHRPMLNPHSQAPAAPAPNGLDPMTSTPPMQPTVPPARRVAPTLRPLSPQPPKSPAAPVSPVTPVSSPLRPVPPAQPPQHTMAPPAAPHPPQPVRPPAVTEIRPGNNPASPRIAGPAGPQMAAIDDIPVPRAMDIDDNPVLISKHVPQDQGTKWRWIIVISLIVLFLLVIFDILLDADFITMRQIPHTHFF